MKLIPISGKNGQGLFAQVDDEDYDYLMQFTWHVNINKSGNLYVNRITSRLNPPRISIALHREIMKITTRNLVIDHIDHNGLNNQKHNLRICTQAQNARNKTSKKGSSSIYLGVSLINRKASKNYPKLYHACIEMNGIVLNLGYFPPTPEGEIIAAKRYDLAANFYFGEFANLNFNYD